MKKMDLAKNGKLLRFLIYIALGVDLLSIPVSACGVYVSWWAWRREAVVTLAGLALFWLSAGCIAVILWQARRILDTVLAGEPFQLANARSMGRAAVACWVLAAESLIRLVWQWGQIKSWLALVSYDTLFLGAFFMAGLLFRVMGALFYQAALLQEDQDLTI